MDSEKIAAVAGAVSAVLIIPLLLKAKRERAKKKNRKCWVRPWIARRNSLGTTNTIMRELEREDSESYRKYLRMNVETFQYLVQLVTPLVKRVNTHLRNAISVEERLAVTLRFLATGASFSDLQYSTRIPQCTISRIVPEMCRAIYEALKEEYMKIPNTPEEWENIAKEMEQKWNVFNCIGAMDGKHIRIVCPKFGGSHNFNYKGFNSVILFALVDANYRILYVDAGTNGRIGDAGVFAKSDLKRCLDNNSLNVPDGKCLPGSDIVLPYTILADDAFPLSKNIMKPYPLRNISKEEKIFNYRLSRGRRMVESCFGILANRFRVFLTPIYLSPSKVTEIIFATCALHNLLTDQRRHVYTQRETYLINDSNSVRWEEHTLDNHENDQMHSLSRQRHHPTIDGREMRNELKNFYNGPGKVPWQDRMI